MYKMRILDILWQFTRRYYQVRKTWKHGKNAKRAKGGPLDVFSIFLKNFWPSYWRDNLEKKLTRLTSQKLLGLWQNCASWSLSKIGNFDIISCLTSPFRMTGSWKAPHCTCISRGNKIKLVWLKKSTKNIFLKKSVKGYHCSFLAILEIFHPLVLFPINVSIHKPHRPPQTNPELLH